MISSIVIQNLPEEVSANIKIEFHTLNLNLKSNLPFKDDCFDIVALLAVIEHLNPDSMALLSKESRRILKAGGRAVLTMPAAWSGGLLTLMAKINLVSAEEIHEHTFAYTLPLIGWHFGQAGFELTKIKFGYFELMLNMWATAQNRISQI